MSMESVHSLFGFQRSELPDTILEALFMGSFTDPPFSLSDFQ